jgi:hypothetical protein
MLKEKAPVIQTVFIVTIIATIPLVFGAVQPVVWSVYAGLMVCFFLVEWWREKIDFGFLRSPALIFSGGIFGIYTLLQAVPLPAGLLRHLSPFQYQVLEQASVLLGHGLGWQSLSYIWRASIAWWMFLFSLFLFFGILQAYVRRRHNLQIVVGVMLGVAFLEAFYGLVQALIPTLGVLWADTTAYLGDARGTFINRNHFAGLIEMTWPMGMGLILAVANLWSRSGYHLPELPRVNPPSEVRNAEFNGARRTGERYGSSELVRRWKNFLDSDRIGLQLLCLIALLFILLAVLFSKSRAGITGVFVGFVAFVILTYLGGKRISWPGWTSMGFGVAFLLFYGNVIGFEEILGRFLMINESADSRMDIWTTTLAIIRDHPFGIGLRNYEHVMPVYNSLTQSGIKCIHAHNDYLQLLAEAGWPGFLALVGGFYLFLGSSIRRIRTFGPNMDPVRFYIGIGACSGLISIAFHSFFDFNLQIPANLLYFVVLLAIVYGCFKHRPLHSA